MPVTALRLETALLSATACPRKLAMRQGRANEEELDRCSTCRLHDLHTTRRQNGPIDEIELQLLVLNSEKSA